ncbi:MAG: GNAT family N-acetyltransferase [Alphaproteobacteria bacterium]|nr:GNAT family N-acetyltransferase [Alphaproteobacteria bacterium]
MISRKAVIEDLPTIIALLADDELGKSRESVSESDGKNYIDAFNKIDSDSNQYLMVVEKESRIVATCHLTIIPSLTFKGSTRMQIEAVRVSKEYRSQQIGKFMISEALNYAKFRNASIIQLTTNKARPDAIHFYKSIGFKDTHEGMKFIL